MKKIISSIAAAAALSAGLIAAAPTPAAHATGCVTVREARTTLDSGRHQSTAEIERGFGTRGWTEDRINGTLWRSYQPCEFPGRRDTWVDVIYAKNHAGNWRSIYWTWALYYPTGYRVIADDALIGTPR